MTVAKALPTLAVWHSTRLKQAVQPAMIRSGCLQIASLDQLIKRSKSALELAGPNDNLYSFHIKTTGKH